MELLVTIAYIFLIRLIFFDYKLLKFTLVWKFAVFGLYIAAFLTEVIMLGQYAPYSKTMFVQAYVVQMAPEYGGKVTEVFVAPNEFVAKGSPLYQMDPDPWQFRLDEAQAQLGAADTSVAELSQEVAVARSQVERTQVNIDVTRVRFEQLQAAELANAVSKLRLEQTEQDLLSLEAQLSGDKAALAEARISLDSEVGGKHTAIAEAVATVETARYNLDQTTVRAPADGYVSNLQLHPGAFVRLKTPLISFVATDKHWIVATVRQRGAQWLEAGDVGEIAFEMYPGQVFPAVVESIVWAAGAAQGVPSGRLPTQKDLHPPEEFAVRLQLTGEHPDHPLRFGASGIAAIYSSKSPDALNLIRKIEIRSESFLNYLYNPF
jgi:multidrug resistance efflux pump